MIYATCTYAPEENEAVVDFLLRKREGVEILPIEVPFDNYQNGLLEWEGEKFNKEVAKSVRILPNEVFNGFFLVKIKKG